MGNVEEILRRAIEEKCGLGGLMRFNALYAGGFERGDGTPDLPGIGEALSRAVAPDQADAIIATVAERLGPARPETAIDGTGAAGTEGKGASSVPPVYNRYFDVEPGEVRDIIDEARRMRAAMGKAAPSQWAPHADKPDVATAQAARAATARGTAGTPAKATTPAYRPARVVAEPLSALDAEIEAFTRDDAAPSSMDIMDFIRHLKDKGYSFQEYIVLEKVYVAVEKRKKEARSAIEKEIEGLMSATPSPAEPEVRALLQRLADARLAFEEGDVRRMIRSAMLRAAPAG